MEATLSVGSGLWWGTGSESFFRITLRSESISIGFKGPRQPVNGWTASSVYFRLSLIVAEVLNSVCSRLHSYRCIGPLAVVFLGREAPHSSAFFLTTSQFWSHFLSDVGFALTVLAVGAEASVGTSSARS
jgi:hypothetical protein